MLILEKLFHIGMRNKNKLENQFPSNSFVTIIDKGSGDLELTN